MYQPFVIMNKFFRFFCIALTAAAQAGPGPIRVLYLGKEGAAAPKQCYVLMQELRA
jgi:hypothetical protein